MEVVFENGEMKKEFTLDEVRATANKWFLDEVTCPAGDC